MITKEMKKLLEKVADLSYQASEEVYREEGTADILNLCDKLYEKIENYFAKTKEEVISKEVIANALEKGVVEIINDNCEEYGCNGLHCKIGDNGFYFYQNLHIIDMPLEIFNRCFSKKEIIDMIYDCLRSESSALNHEIGVSSYKKYQTILNDAYHKDCDYEVEL